MKNKKIAILSLLFVLFLSFSSCYAENTSTNKENDLFDKARYYWTTTVDWFNKDIRPWIEKQTTPEAKDEYKQKFKELLNRVPEGFNELMNKIGQIFK